MAAGVFVAAGIGVGMAATSKDVDQSAKSSAQSKVDGAMHADKKGHQGKVDPAHQAWAHKYGVDRSTMSNLAPADAATDAQRAAATELLLRTESATAKYANLDTARAAGFDLKARLAVSEQKKPNFAKELEAVDAGTMLKGGKMPMLHVANKANKKDGKMLDPAAPETLMYEYSGNGNWKLIGVMYTASEAYPKAPPDPGGPITRWHYHDKSGGQRLMMHVFFRAGNDLAHAFAAEMS